MSTVTPIVKKPRKPLSTRGAIRVSIENSIEQLKGVRTNISGPHYKIVQGVAEHLDVGGKDARSYNSKGLDELEITLTQCLAAVQVARMRQKG